MNRASVSLLFRLFLGSHGVDIFYSYTIKLRATSPRSRAS
jgi:hypothetical protein